MARSSATSRQFDFATLLGVIAAFGLLFYAIRLGGNLKSYLDLQAALIIIGGTLGATFINHPFSEVLLAFSMLGKAFFPNKNVALDRISRILHYSRRLRSETIEEVRLEFDTEGDFFFREALQLLGDGVDEQEIRKVMSIELTFLEDRNRRGAQLFQTMGTLAPAMGLIGTLIGLVQMLQNLENSAAIGPAMAIALISTFYGAVFANLVFIPLAGKLRSRSEEDFALKELTIEGVRALAAKINPLAIERRLLGFLPPEKRQSEYE